MTQAVTKKPRAVPPPLPRTSRPGPASSVRAIAPPPPVKVQGPLKQVLLRVDESAAVLEDGESAGDRRTQWDDERSVEFVNDTYFVGGLSADCSGVFVATYRRVAVGTKVHLGFEMSDGRVVEARGVVRWTREVGHGAERPGLGVTFTEVSESARAEIADFCRSKPPLYFEL